MFAPWRSQSPLRIAEGSDYWQLIYSFSGSEQVRNVSWESPTKNDNVRAGIVGHQIVVLRSVPRIFSPTVNFFVNSPALPHTYCWKRSWWTSAVKSSAPPRINSRETQWRLSPPFAKRSISFGFGATAILKERVNNHQFHRP